MSGKKAKRRQERVAAARARGVHAVVDDPVASPPPAPARDIARKSPDELIREQVKGMRFERKRDPEDPRFDVVTIRIANPQFENPDFPVEDECSFAGSRARWRFVQFGLATAIRTQPPAQVVAMLRIGLQHARSMEAEGDTPG